MLNILKRIYSKKGLEYLKKMKMEMYKRKVDFYRISSKFETK